MDSLLFWLLSGAWFRRFFPALGFLGVLLSIFPPASGQVRLLHQMDGTFDSQALGFSVDGVGDLNGDEKSDFIIASLGTFSALVYSGADGVLLYQIIDTPLVVAGAGDVNGDGIPDFMIGAPDERPGGIIEAGSAYVYSGADGTLLYRKDGAALQQSLGISVDGAGDVNGDGKADFIIGHSNALRGNSAGVFSGADGGLLYEVISESCCDQLGTSVAGAGDVNGDGKDDFIVGAPDATPGGKPYAGSAYVYSGADGALLYQIDGDTNTHLGSEVAGLGDINGDDRSDFIIKTGGTALVYSGINGALLFQKKPAPFASSAAGAGDVNGDGTVDFIVGAFAVGSVFVYSGATGALLYQINGDSSVPRVAGAGDVDGDGRSDFIIGADYAKPGGIYRAGAVFVYAGIATGDLNGDNTLNLEDVVVLINCTFLGIGSCQPGVADLNCDGELTSSDVVLALNLIFLGQTPPNPC